VYFMLKGAPGGNNMERPQVADGGRAFRCEVRREYT